MVGKREKSGEQEVILKGAGGGNVSLISDPEPLITTLKMPKLSAPPRIPC